MKSRAVLFNSGLKSYILSIFGKKVDESGYVVDKALPNQKETADGELIQANDFAGVRKGSVILFKSDYTSLLKVADTLDK